MNNNDCTETLVLVTGASGYIGSHCVRLLLSEGYRVRGTVRSLKNAAKVEPVKKLANKDDHLELVEADLMDADCWLKALEGCDYVLHVASPFPIVANEKCIKTAVTGTLNVLRAVAKTNSVKKVVLTSSCAAVNEGHDQDQLFDERSWTNVDSEKVDFYARSKTLAERAAWEFMDSISENQNKFALTTLNPTLVFGPMLIDEQGASVTLIRRFLNSEMPAVPNLNMGCVDVRDVARAHLEAMRRPEADGQRFLISSRSLWFRDIARALGKEFRNQGYWVPRFTAPYWMVWIYSFIDAEASACLHRLGNKVNFDNSKAQRLLGIEFRDPSEAVIDMGYSAIERGIVKRTSSYRGVPDSRKCDTGISMK